MQRLTDLPEWHALTQHHEQIKNIHMRDLFQKDKTRFDKFSLSAAGLFLDYSKNRINEETLSLLIHLADARHLKNKIEDLFSAKPINTTEQRAALHTALRDPGHSPIYYQDQNVSTDIQDCLQRMHDISETIRQQKWRGYKGDVITDIVNIGIGGSERGPAMTIEALAHDKTSSLNFHFISNIDGHHVTDVLKRLNPETTLFIVSSKSFSTLETLKNAKVVLDWYPEKSNRDQHFIAITLNKKSALDFGISEKNILPLWDWVGGRYSIWSAIGLPLMIAIGIDKFKEFLKGAHTMDEHFKNAPFSQNMPLLLALLGIWYCNFFKAQTHAILPYDHQLQLFPSYLKQLVMESIGKNRTHSGTLIDYETSPIVWGEAGCNGQHAFHQALHQGTHLTPTDFMTSISHHHTLDEHHQILYASCLSQTQALMEGKKPEEILHELINQGYPREQAEFLSLQQSAPGNQPSNTLIYNKLTPEILGALIALYEHKTYVQSIIWDINAFDQWGIELGKRLAKNILKDLTENSSTSNYDVSTKGLMKIFKDAHS
ncbi:MAG: glucose-6-phosphate isomerase [Proteobacteria bacterium]|nr:glucose-6-phosphate isomerase [Pseudomonadota bacterium]